MGTFSLHKCLEKLIHGEKMERDEWLWLLCSLDKKGRAEVSRCAAEVSEKQFGRGIFIRGLIEISSYCRNNCNYCGLRCSNGNAQRYRLSKEEILECCRQGAELGFNTFVLQGGEDPKQNDGWVTDVVHAIKDEFPDKAVTLSVGERSREAYNMFRMAGADRYLLRHETRNDAHYAQLHPASMSGERRRHSLFTLKELGFQTGSGMMIGSPWQKAEHIVDDIAFLEELQPQMIGIGPFIPAAGTPFEKFPQGSVELTILVVSLLRLRFPNALIPATTALASLHPQGREMAIMGGANVVMPNLSPQAVREKYSIYNNKKSTGAESAQQLQFLEEQLNAIGYHIDYSRGDYVEHDNIQ